MRRNRIPSRTSLNLLAGIILPLALGVASLGLITAASVEPLRAQDAGRNIVYDSTLFDALSYRMVGPFRGGRSTAVTGVPGEVHTFLMGTTGGGVWKTDDAGTHWRNISDGHFGLFFLPYSSGAPQAGSSHH